MASSSRTVMGASSRKPALTAASRSRSPRSVQAMAMFRPGASSYSGLPSRTIQPSGAETSAFSPTASGQILQRNCMS